MKVKVSPESTFRAQNYYHCCCYFPA